MATNEIQNGCESSIEAVLASNHKRRCVKDATLLADDRRRGPVDRSRLRINSTPTPTPTPGVAGHSTKRYPEAQRADQGYCWPRIPVAAPQPGISHSRPARR